MEVALPHTDITVLHTNDAFSLKKRLFSPYRPMEITIAMAMVGILAMVATLNILPERYKARQTLASKDITILREAIEAYKLSNAHYPSTAEGLAALQGSYAFRNDPWGHAYQYFYTEQTSQYKLYSFGNDGKAGGIGKAQDIGVSTPMQEAQNSSE